MVLNPDFSTVKMYVPGSRLMIVNVPSSFVCIVLLTFVSWFVTFTKAVGMVFPPSSSTTPVTSPVGVCANRHEPGSNSTAKRKRHRTRLLLNGMQFSLILHLRIVTRFTCPDSSVPIYRSRFTCVAREISKQAGREPNRTREINAPGHRMY